MLTKVYVTKKLRGSLKKTAKECNMFHIYGM